MERVLDQGRRPDPRRECQRAAIAVALRHLPRLAAHVPLAPAPHVAEVPGQAEIDDGVLHHGGTELAGLADQRRREKPPVARAEKELPVAVGDAEADDVLDSREDVPHVTAAVVVAVCLEEFQAISRGAPVHRLEDGEPVHGEDLHVERGGHDGP